MRLRVFKLQILPRAPSVCPSARSLASRTHAQRLPAHTVLSCQQHAPQLFDPGALRMHACSFKVYTRTGDGGSSSLFSGERRRKDDAVFAALGHTDELNAAIGLVRAVCAEAGSPLGQLHMQLGEVQSRLIDVGSAIATPPSTSQTARVARTAFDGDGEAALLEGWIDAMDAELPQLKTFILPAGGQLASTLHLARAVCRRAERAVVPLVLAGECEKSVEVYVNRLSDYLFVAARFASHRTGETEVPYQKTKARREESLFRGEVE